METAYFSGFLNMCTLIIVIPKKEYFEYYVCHRCHALPKLLKGQLTIVSYSLICSDVDECATPANLCKYACKNTVGSFLCVCPEGYVQRGADECIGEYLHSSLMLLQNFVKSH